jgi:carboxyl-terminal processing protease
VVSQASDSRFETFGYYLGNYEVRDLRVCSLTFNIVGFCLVVCSYAVSCKPQEITPQQRRQAQAMLKDVANDVKGNYYDWHMHGVDWDAKVREAQEKIDEADSISRALTAIASAVDSLDDSHTFFLPPPRPYTIDYGFEMQMIGDRCFVIRVRRGSDAEANGLKPGDEIETLNGYKPTRSDFWRMKYLFWILRPQPRFLLKIRTAAGQERQASVVAKFTQHSKVVDLYEENYFSIAREMADEEHSEGVRYVSRGYDLLIIRLPIFMQFRADETGSIVSKMQGYKAVIFDLRGNPGGTVDMASSLLGGVFERKLKIGDRIERSKTTMLETEHHRNAFNGKVAVLIDSESASASEIFARVIQLEKRGVVVGDRSAGKVMEALQFVHRTEGDKSAYFIPYGTEVTVADIILADGQSLEHSGVTPDVVVLPTASDLANGRDPVMSKAVEMMGVAMTPEEAGKLFPYEWPKE